jgi:hypothetical protein
VDGLAVWAVGLRERGGAAVMVSLSRPRVGGAWSAEHAKLTMYSQKSLLGNEAIAEKLYGPDLFVVPHIQC